MVDAGCTVYVDWIEAPQLDRQSVSKASAAVLRERMDSCKTLLFATSSATKKSIWMPWELGYMDAKTKSRVAIVPIVEDLDADKEFIGQEYLGLYPYLDKTGASYFIHETFSRYMNFRDWFNGASF